MSNLKFRHALNFMGFLATMLIAVALVISLLVSIFQHGSGIMIFKISDFVSALVFCSSLLAYFITIIAGFSYAKTKSNRWFMALQIVGTVLIIAAIIVGAFF